MPRTVRVVDLQSYVDAVERQWLSWTDRYNRISPTWFRGHGDADWPLLPGFYRPGRRPDENRYRHEFTQRAIPFLGEATALPTSDWDWYFLMQHYGLPTRLLDWSESALVGLFFAVQDRNLTRDGAVWIFSPQTHNTATSGEGLIPPHLHERVGPYLPQLWANASAVPLLPLAIDPPHNSKRLAAQRGKFTIHGRRLLALDKIPRTRPAFAKVTIPAGKKDLLRRQLLIAGITEGVLFPGLAGLGAEIRDTYSNPWSIRAQTLTKGSAGGGPRRVRR